MAFKVIRSMYPTGLMYSNNVTIPNKNQSRINIYILPYFVFIFATQRYLVLCNEAAIEAIGNPLFHHSK